MKICDLCTETDGQWARLTARIDWEDADKPSNQYFFQVPLAHADKWGNGADAFLCAALVPALRNGERRVWVEDPVCPVLLENLQEALFWIRSWNRNAYQDRNIDLDCRRRDYVVPPVPKSALFLSGGVDANYAMYQNRLSYPAGHPGRARFGVAIYGFDIGGKQLEYGLPATRQAFERALQAIQKATASCDIELIPLHTNIRHLDDTSGFWGQQFVGAALASVAHALGAAASQFYLSSAGEPVSAAGDLAHYGTHPLLDPCYSGYSVKIRHYLVHHDSRIQRLLCLAEVPRLLDNIRVCYNTPADRLNCGKCEKCVRTKLMLDVFGRLEGCGAFEDLTISSNVFDSIAIDSESVAMMYRELLGHCESVGYRHTQRIRELLKRYETYKNWKGELTWKGKVKRFDRRHLKGVLSRLFASPG